MLMIQKLCYKSLLCYVGDVYCGFVMYADDLIPVSTSVNLLQRMIDTCCEEAVHVYLDMKFNALKLNIRYGPKCNDLNTELHVDSSGASCSVCNRSKV